jgi:hypothetical protein
MAVPEVSPPTCCACGVLFPVGRRTSQERMDTDATKAGWVLGLPHNRALCPEHRGEPWTAPRRNFVDNRTFFENLSKPPPLPEGTRIELVAMPNDPDAIPVGTKGTVTGGNAAQMYVDWDDHRSLILLPGIDRWRVV